MAQRNPDTGRHLWYSGKAGAFGGNVQVVMDFRRVPGVHRPGGAWLDPRPDRRQTPRAAGPVPVGLAGDAGAGGQGVPGRRHRRADTHEEPPPDPGRADPQQPAVRPAAPAERANAMFKHFRALQHVSLDPAAITTIMAAALVIITLWHDSWKVILGVSQVISGGRYDDGPLPWGIMGVKDISP